jgi:hypothetical protein
MNQPIKSKKDEASDEEGSDGYVCQKGKYECQCEG